MADAADVSALDDDIVAAAQKPASATVDGNSVNSRSIDEKLKARNDAAGQIASGKAHFGLRFTKLIPDGCG